MTHDELFLEIKRALSPLDPDTAALRSFPLADARDLASRAGGHDQHPRPDGDLPQYRRVALDLPQSEASSGWDIPRNSAADYDHRVSSGDLDPCCDPGPKGGARPLQKEVAQDAGGAEGLERKSSVDVTAQVATQELIQIQQEIIASSVKTARVSLTIGVHTSSPAWSSQQYEACGTGTGQPPAAAVAGTGSHEWSARLCRIAGNPQALSVCTARHGGRRPRDHDLLTPHAADLLALELPWAGTSRSPLMAFETPYRQLLSVLALRQCSRKCQRHHRRYFGNRQECAGRQDASYRGREDVQVSIIERGDSYYHPVTFMGGQMITMSLDSDQTINPFDLEAGETQPSNDHLAFLKNLTRYMIGDSGDEDTDLLDNLIMTAIRKTYARAQMRLDNPIPLFSDLYDELQNYYDEDKNQRSTKPRGLPQPRCVPGSTMACMPSSLTAPRPSTCRRRGSTSTSSS